MEGHNQPTVRNNLKFQLGFTSVKTVIIALAVGYILVGLFLAALHFDFMVGDITNYWQDSFKPQSAFNPDYPPLYPLMIVILRTITFGLLPPAGLMMSIVLAFLLLGGWFVYRIAKESGSSDGIAALGAFLYGYWPLVGLTYAAYPKFDVPSVTLFLGGLYFLQTRRLRIGAGLVGISLLSHKAMWPVGLMALAAFVISNRKLLPRYKLVEVLIVGVLPLGLYWLIGAVIHGSLAWLLSFNIGVQVVSMSNLPVLDGALGTFLRGTPNEVLKGLIIAGFGVLAAWLCFACLRDKPSMYLVGAAICVEIIFLWLILNQGEIWVMARYSRLLVVPLIWIITGRSKHTSLSQNRQRISIAAGLSATILSQFVYAWYMVKIFYV